jgi:gliding motility-associated-like protein
MYKDTILTPEGCDSLVNANLTVSPNINLGPDQQLCLGQSILLNPGTFKNYLWQDGSIMPTFKVTVAGTYWVKVTDENGCIGADTVLIKPSTCLSPPLPNTFTPNGDGINDTWELLGLQSFPECTVFIYDRWGQAVFKSTGYSRPWDGTYNGKKLPFGTYYYVIDLKNNTPLISGDVTIVR